MACECYTTVKEKLSTHLQSKLPKGATNFNFELEGYLFGFTDDGVTHRSSNSVKVRYQAPKKAGGMKWVRQSTFVRASFCPFCGVGYDEPVKAAE